MSTGLHSIVAQTLSPETCGESKVEHRIKKDREGGRYLEELGGSELRFYSCHCNHLGTGSRSQTRLRLSHLGHTERYSYYGSVGQTMGCAVLPSYCAEGIYLFVT